MRPRIITAIAVVIIGYHFFFSHHPASRDQNSNTSFVTLSFHNTLYTNSEQYDSATHGADARPDTARANEFIKLAAAFSGEAHYDSSIVYYEKAAEIFLSYEMWSDYLLCLNWIGYNAIFALDYTTAQETLNKSIRLSEFHLGENHIVRAGAFNVLGILYRHQGEFIKSAESYKTASSIYHTSPEKYQDEIGTNYNNLCVVYRFLGNYPAAIDYCINSLKIREIILESNHISIGAVYNNLGVAYKYAGKLDDAITSYTRALDILRVNVGEIHPRTGMTYNNIGALYQEKGEFRTALGYHRSALTILEQTYINTPNHPQLALVYNNLGVLYRVLGDYEQSLNYHHRALSIRLERFGEIHHEIAQTYQTLGRLYRDLKKFDEALEYANHGLKINEHLLGEIHPRLFHDHHNIGNTLREQGKHDKALYHFKKALHIVEQTYQSDHVTKSRLYKSMGILYFMMGDLDGSLKLYTNALEIFNSTAGPRHPGTASLYRHIGDNYKEQNQYPDALRSYQRGLTAISPSFADTNIARNPVTDDILSYPEFYSLLTAKAHTLYINALSMDGDLDLLKSAHETYMLTAEVISLMRRDFREEKSKLFLSEHTHEIIGRAIECAMDIYNRTGEPEFLLDAFSLAEHSRSAVLWESIVAAEAKIYAEIPDSLIQQKNDYFHQIQYYRREIQMSDIEEDRLRLYHERLFALNRQYQKLITSLSISYPRYHDLISQVDPITVAQIQETLDQTTILVEYFLTSDNIYIFRITRETIDVVTVAIDQSFPDIVDALRTSISQVDPMNYIASSSALYRHLIQPIEDIVLSFGHMIVIPDGALHHVPFEALLRERPRFSGILVDFSDLPYLIRDISISYHYSAALYVASRKEKYDDIPRFAGFAPVFSDQSSVAHRLDFEPDELRLTGQSSYTPPRFNPLPSSEEEVLTIMELMHAHGLSGDAYIYTDATTKVFNELTGYYSIVHIASHGIYNEQHPDLSGIAFYTQENEFEYTYHTILYAGELYTLNFHADLLVISSCESGTGPIVRGEGLIAITRGFIYSGISNLIVSTRKVYDRYSSELMIDFYQRLLDGKSYAMALREAKMALIEKEDTAFPLLWSGFILIGK
jgi:CHAT domain-containing protein